MKKSFNEHKRDDQRRWPETQRLGPRPTEERHDFIDRFLFYSRPVNFITPRFQMQIYIFKNYKQCKCPEQTSKIHLIDRTTGK